MNLDYKTYINIGIIENLIMKILIIDDNESITKMMGKMLKLEGHECTIANGGKEGLKLIRSNQFGAITLDLAMPEFSGTDVIDTLVQDGTLQNHKIIVNTASSTIETQLEGLKEKGVYGVLKKPIDYSELNKLLSDIQK